MYSTAAPRQWCGSPTVACVPLASRHSSSCVPPSPLATVTAGCWNTAWSTTRREEQLFQTSCKNLLTGTHTRVTDSFGRQGAVHRSRCGKQQQSAGARARQTPQGRPALASATASCACMHACVRACHGKVAPAADDLRVIKDNGLALVPGAPLATDSELGAARAAPAPTRGQGWDDQPQVRFELVVGWAPVR